MNKHHRTVDRGIEKTPTADSRPTGPREIFAEAEACPVLAATRQFFTRVRDHGPCPIEVTTDHAAAYPRVLDELVPAACHVTEQYRNNPIEADHGRLKSRLRAMRGLKQLPSARVITAGHAFIQNIRRGHYKLGAEETVNLRVPAAFDELVMAI